MGKVEQISITINQYNQMLNHVSQCLPEEGCGLIGGNEDRAMVVFPVENELHSPVRFQMNPQEQLHAMQQMDGDGMAMIAIYHSHPNGPERPSITDLQEMRYPGTIYLIWSKTREEWKLRVFKIQTEQAVEIELLVI